MDISKIRDLTLVKLDQERTMVMACDSCGGAGMKEGDILQVSPFISGKFTARVAILEIMCTGAEMVCLANTICNEMEPTGKAVIKGIEEELEAAGIGKIVLTGSTEENFTTISTGIGITAVGIVNNTKLKVNNVKGDALLVAFGQPKVGQEVLTSEEGDIVSYNIIRNLVALEEVYEIVPVGSKGILYEAELLGKNNGLELILEEKLKLDIWTSGGPATMVVAAVGEMCFNFNRKNLFKNAQILGRLKKVNSHFYRWEF